MQIQSTINARPGRRRKAARPPWRLGALAMALCTAPAAMAMEFDMGGGDTKLRWDNTFKYSTMRRLKSQDPKLVAPANLDDGDRSFNKGIVSNRVDWLTEFDASYKDVGLRVSAAAWYDSVYNNRNDNTSAATWNALSVPFNQFPGATREIHGRKIELLDAFVFGRTEFANGMAGSFRVGRFAQTWGESLFFGDNGIAGGLAPLDIIKLVTVPGSQFKEILRPVEQVSGQLELNPSLSVAAYVQARSPMIRLPEAGSYFSGGDVLLNAGERLIVGAPMAPGGGPAAFFRGQDQKAKRSGQWGTQLRFRPEGGEIDYGLYAIRYNAKAPVTYLRAGNGFNAATGQVGDFIFTYPEGIKAFGASATTTLGGINYAAEVSVRRNMPLANPGVSTSNLSDNRYSPAYPVGKTAHAQASMIAVNGPAAFWRSSSLLAEVAWNRRTSITKNAAALDPSADRDAAAMRMIFTTNYFNVLVDGLDVSVPIGLGYNISGNSSVTGWAAKTGDLSIGINGVYRQAWRFGLNWTHYLGPAGPYFNASNTLGYKQYLKDRDFVSFNLQRSF
ncbi:DUF1302 domain-containing protein [Caenimonas soli]|uniref:DUF1302 domain-containing protein n=1 Tax=Caenimonas soli TaxID=2735555 RepID=UPI0015580B44|nr:DUF1302 family protein [Caenimonas soli]NPC55919.1 DUF1302 family protein [Caenimonas soli]